MCARCGRQMMHLRAPQGSRTCVVIRASLLSQVVTRLAFSNLYKHAIRHNAFQGLSEIVDGLKNKNRRRKTCDALLTFVLTKKVGSGRGSSLTQGGAAGGRDGDFLSASPQR